MKIETKYDVGDEVWLMANNMAVCRKIGSIYFTADNECNELTYSLEHSDKDDVTWWDYEESELFPTKEELLKSL